MKKLLIKLEIAHWQNVRTENQSRFIDTGNEAYWTVVKLAGIQIVRLKRKLKNLSYKPFYIYTASNDWRVGDLITPGTALQTKFLVLKTKCKDSWWTNFKAFLGLKPSSIEGGTKVKQHDI